MRADPQRVALRRERTHEVGEAVFGVLRQEDEALLRSVVADQPLAQRGEPEPPGAVLADVDHVAVVSQFERAVDRLPRIVVAANAHLRADPQHARESRKR